MQRVALRVLLGSCCAAVALARVGGSGNNHALSIYRLEGNTIDGHKIPMEKYAGKVSLFVNIASKDPTAQEQLLELNALYNKYRHKGFEVLAFPCNQFGQQEPHTNKFISEELREANVEFPLFAKTNVRSPQCTTKAGCAAEGGQGDECCNVNNGMWALLRAIFSEQKIKWNFSKFLVARDGKPVKRFAHTMSPMKMEKDIRYHLGLDRRPALKHMDGL